MWEVSWRLNRTATNWYPPTLLAITAFLSRSPGLLNRGPGGPTSAWTWFSFQHHLSNWSDFLSHPGYIIIWRPPASCESHNSHSIQPVDSQGYPPYIFDRMHLLFTQLHFLLWQIGRGPTCNKLFILIWFINLKFIINMIKHFPSIKCIIDRK